MNLRRVVAAALVVIVPLAAACRRRSEATRPPAPSVSAVSSESPSAKPVEARVGDVVEIAASATLSGAPGGQASAYATSGPALVIASGVAGLRRVLLADGTSGWTSAPLRTLAAARFQSSTKLEINRYPPGDPRRKDIEDPQLMVTVPASAMARIAGASFELDAPSDRALRLDQAPFLEQPNLLLQFDAKTTGFVHGLEIEFEWEPKPFVDLASLPGFVRGIVRRPFLEPFAKAAIAVAPHAGDMTHVVNGFDPMRVLPAPLHKWASLETLVRDPAAKPGAIVSLAVVADGGSMAFVFTGSNKSESLVLRRAELGSPWITRVVTADLDADGLAEWLIEVVDRTSDGLATRLLVVAGNSMQTKFSGAAIELGEESGESDAPTARYAWYVDGDHLFVARDFVVRGMCESFSLVKALPVFDSPSPRLAVAKSFDDASSARTDAFASRDGRQALPVVIGGKRRWASARCFRSLTDATAWAGQVGGRVL